MWAVVIAMEKDRLEEIKKVIFERLSREYNTKDIYVFGSHAYGKPTKDSDLDVAIIVSKSDEPSYKRSRRGYSKIRDIDYPIEILVFTEDEVRSAKKVKTSLISTILKKGIKLSG